jgi:hypothetical protein
MVEKLIKCPICNEPARFIITEDAVAGKRFPVPCILEHKDHSFIAYLDSELSFCDVEKPFMIKSEP